MWRTCFLFFLALFWAFSLSAQPCGLTDTLSIAPNTNPSYTFEVFDIFNNDLSAADQGVCGVEIRFAHQYIDNLVLSLTSPGGQSVTLIGPNTDQQFEFTFGSIWNIGFVPCLELPAPDPGSLFIWDNNQVGNFSNLNLYNGTYYPYQGCLEDFSLGPANGSWTLSVENAPSDYMGEITYFRIEFCDGRGPDCCFAEGGRLLAPDILTCEGDTSLNIEPLPEFSGGSAPDTAIYGYTYLLGQDGLLMDTTASTDLTGFAPGNYQICGLSYQLEDADSIPLPDGVLTLDSIRANLDGLEPRFCGEMSDSCISVTILPLPTPEMIETTICPGDSIMVGDTILKNSGFYEVELPSYAGCDSLVQIDLTVLSTVTTALTDTLCPGQIFQIGDTPYSTSGTFRDTLISTAGCDSIVTLNLTVLEPNVVDTMITICEGESFMVGDSILTQAGEYSFFLTSAQNCDSTLNLTLEVLSPTAEIAPAFDLTCITTMVDLDGTGSTPTGQLSFQWYSPDGLPLGTAPTQTASQPGAFVLEVSQMSSDLITCTNFDTLLVQIDTIPPVSDAGPNDTLTCTQGSVTLGGITSANPEHTYFWYTPDGQISGDVFQPTAVADEAGSYFLVVTDIDNRCSDTSMALVFEDQSLPVVLPGADTLLSCFNPTLTLDGSASSTGAEFEYEWRDESGGLIQNGTTLFPTVTQGGTYQLMVENTQTNCRDSATIEVSYDTIAPRIIMPIPDTLTCTQSQVTLSGMANAAGPFPVYSWSSATGQILTDTTNLEITVAEGGLYSLIAENTLNGCRDTASVTITEDISVVVSEIAPPDTLTCTQTTIALNGGASSSGSPIIYQWTGDPAPPGSTNGNSATATAPGSYQLIVTDTSNTCADTASVWVVQDTLHPFSSAGPNRTLTCDSTLITLDGTGSSTGSHLAYEWVEVFGNGLVSTSGLNATIDSPGAYQLVVSNTQNGCFDTALAIVNIDTLSPHAALSAPLRLDCNLAEVALDGSGSDNGPGFSFSWSSDAPGNFVSGTNTLMPVVNAPGQYQIEIENDSTGCTKTAQAIVFQDTVPPLAEAGPDTLIDCSQPAVTIGSSATSTGPDIIYSWAGPAGGLSGPVNEVFAMANAPGLYRLSVRNTTTGCEASDTVLVSAGSNFPVALAGPDQQLDCSVPEVLLSSAGSTTNQTTVSWAGPCISGSATEPAVTATCDGTYVLTVTDTLIGCSSTDTVLVTRDSLSPASVLPDTLLLSCTDGTALLDATSSAGDTFEWLFNGSPIFPPGLSFSVDSAGVYTLIANNAAGNCPDTARTLVTFGCSPMMAVTPPDTLTCAAQTITLDATATETGPNIIYNWTAPGPDCIESGAATLQPVVRCPGIYWFVATNTLFNSSDTLLVTVPSNTTAPVAEAGPGDTLTCPEPTTVLSAAGSASGPGIGYTWTKLDDENFVRDSFSIFVNDASTYFLTVIDSTNGCFSEDIAVVQRSDNLPDINFSSTLIPCMQDSFWLQAFVVPQGPDYDYVWEGQNILEGADSMAILVDSAGIMRLTVTNPANSCSTFRDVIVRQQDCVPCLDSIPAGVITCAEPEATLTGSFCEPCIGCVVSWSADDGGSILSSPDSLEITVGQPGVYTLTATDTLGFSAVVPVTVSESTSPPGLNMGPAQMLNCRDTAVLLNPITDSGSELSYQWSAVGGQLPSIDSLPTLTVTEPGLYRLILTDQETGCEAMGEISVLADTLSPIADAGPDQELTCEQPTITLDGSNSTFGNAIVYSWSGPTGTTIPGNMTFNPSVSTPGSYALVVTDTTNGCSSLDSVLVMENSTLPPLPDLEDTLLTCSTAAVQLNGSLPGDIGFSSCWYRLDNSGNPSGPCVPTLAIDVSLPGQYAFEVTNDSSGCANAIVVEVGLDTLSPDLVLPDTLVFPCDADSLSISAAASPDAQLSFQWSSVSGLPIGQADQATAVVFQPGIYQVEVERNDNGCSVTRSLLVVSDDRIPVVTTAPDTIITCSNSLIRLRVDVETESGQSGILWETETGHIVSGDTTSTPQIDAPGWYIAYASDLNSGCVAVDSIWVADGRIAPLADLNAPDGLTLNCKVDSLLLDGSATSGGTGEGIAYEWRRGAFNTIGNAPAQWVTEVGSYRLIVQDLGSGCQDTLQVQVDSDFEAPSVQLQDPAPLDCSTTTVTLDGSASENAPEFQYIWLDSNAEVIAEDTFEISVSAAGSYTLQIIDTLNGCSASETVIVQDDAVFPTIIISPPLELSCNQVSVELDGSGSTGEGPLTFNWTAHSNGMLEGATNQPIATAGAEGVYILTLTDQSNDCTATDTVMVSASSPLIEEVAWQVRSPSCPGDRDGAIALDSISGGTPPFLFALDGAPLSTVANFPNLAPGSYALLLEDANGCRWDSTMTIAASDGIKVDLGPDTTIQQGQEITLFASALSGAADSIWWWPATGIQEDPAYTVAPTITTVFQAWAQDSNGCTDQDQIEVKVIKDIPVYAPTVFSPNGDNSNDRFLLYGRDGLGTLVVFRIFDRWGNLVHEARNCPLNDESCGWDGRFRGNEMDSDVFTFYAEISLEKGGATVISGDVLLLR